MLLLLLALLWLLLLLLFRLLVHVGVEESSGGEGGFFCILFCPIGAPWSLRTPRPSIASGGPLLSQTSKWSRFSSAAIPPPRCSHQAVTRQRADSGGEMWVFGGEYVTPRNSEFYHFDDLWCFDFAQLRWASVEPAPDSARPPSARYVGDLAFSCCVHAALTSLFL